MKKVAIEKSSSLFLKNRARSDLSNNCTHNSYNHIDKNRPQRKSTSQRSFSLEAIQDYLAKISSNSLLTREEEVECALKIKAKDYSSYERMITSNLRLVVKVARRYLNRGLLLSDLIGEGNLGLIHAIKKFRPEYGFRFSTYALCWIKQSIERAIMNQGRTIRLPVHVSKLLHSYLKASSELSKLSSVEPKVEDIAKKMARPVRDVNKVLRFVEESTAIGGIAKRTNDYSIIDSIADTKDGPETALIQKDLSKKINSHLHSLSERHQTVLQLRFGLNMDGSSDQKSTTFIEIGKKMKISRERARQITCEAIDSLRKLLKNDYIP